MKRLLITLCTYNERDNVRLLIPELLETATAALQSLGIVADASTNPAADAGPVSILVIDDGSPDGTGDCVEELGREDPRVQLMQRGSKQGLGTATLAGFEYAIGQQFDWLLNLDADFSHNPKYIPSLLNAMSDCDVAIASRYVAGGSVGDWPLSRRLMSKSINVAARLLLGLRTQDNSGSYRCYSVSRLAEIDWTRTIATGYAFQEEVLYRCRRIGCTFRECPIVFEERRYGQTKISGKECISAGTVLLRLGWQNLTRQRVACSP